MIRDYGRVLLIALGVWLINYVQWHHVSGDTHTRTHTCFCCLGWHCVFALKSWRNPNLHILRTNSQLFRSVFTFSQMNIPPFHTDLLKLHSQCVWGQSLQFLFWAKMYITFCILGFCPQLVNLWRSFTVTHFLSLFRRKPLFCLFSCSGSIVGL